MQNDILSHFVANDSSRNLVGKICKVAFVLMLITIIYAFIDLIDWYINVSMTIDVKFHIKHFFYNYRVRPFIAAVDILINVYIGINQYYAWKNFNVGIDEGDSNLFNKGLQTIYLLFKLNIISFVLIGFSLVYRLISWRLLGG